MKFFTWYTPPQPPKPKKKSTGEIQIDLYNEQLQHQYEQAKENYRFFIINTIFTLANLSLAFVGAVYIYHTLTTDNSKELLKQSIEIQTKQLEQLQAIQNTLSDTLTVKLDSTTVRKK